MNWTHWSFQALFLIATAGATLHVARVRDARLRLWTLQLTLLACLLLPMLAPTLPSIVIPFDGVVSAPSGIASRVTLTFSPRYVWLLGATVVLSRLLLAMMRVRSLRKQSQPFEQRGAVEIRTSVEVVSPVTFGFLHPLVLLPETARTVEVEVREPMIAHELEHIRRKDWLMVLAEEIIRAAAWFHPAVWWLLSRIRAAREQLIDAAVAQAAGADRYAESLLTAARWRASLRETQPFPAVAMHGGGSLEQRLQRILYPKESSMTRFHRAAAVTALAFSTFGMVAISTSAFPLFAQQKVNPKIIKKSVPAYPSDAKAAKIQGTVVLAIRVGTDGFVGNIELVSGHPLLAQAAIDSVRTWEFEPGRKNGVAVEVATTIDINFTLN